MTFVTTAPLAGLPFGRELTVDDLEAMPDDGHRYELVDGVLIVSPAPIWAHQAAQFALHKLLHAACPAGLRVIGAPAPLTGCAGRRRSSAVRFALP